MRQGEIAMWMSLDGHHVDLYDYQSADTELPFDVTMRSLESAHVDDLLGLYGGVAPIFEEQVINIHWKFRAHQAGS